MLDAKSWISQLSQHGYRLTAARRAVVNVMAGSNKALSPGEIHQAAQERYPALGLVSVYRTLEKLESLHLIQRVHQDGGCQAYVAAGQGHQHLLVCQDCSSVTLFEGDDLDALIDVVARKTGYEILEHWLQLVGRCTFCKNQ